jgi:hypothetical protein
MKKLEGVKVAGYHGTWYEIDRLSLDSDNIYIMLESEQDGDEVAGIIINDKGVVIVDEAYDCIESELAGYIQLYKIMTN